MPAHHKPSNVLALKGAFVKDPARGRQRAAEPVVDIVDVRTLTTPPTLSDLEALVWAETIDRMPAGVVSRGDVHALTGLVRLTTRIIYDVEIDTKIIPQWRGLLAMFGMTPADRSRVSASKGAKKTSPLDEFND